MKKSFLLFITIVFVFFQQDVFAAVDHEICFKKNHRFVLSETDTGWVPQLRAFKAAVAANDTKKVSSFFDLPMITETDDLWYLINQANKDREEIRADTIRYFTKQDFDKNYNKIFSKKFINALSKIKIEELKRKGESETVKYKDGPATTYKMIATLDTAEQTLTLGLAFHRVKKNKKGIVESSEEYGTLYLFSIKDGQLKFIKIMMTA